MLSYIAFVCFFGLFLWLASEATAEVVDVDALAHQRIDLDEQRLVLQQLLDGTQSSKV